MTRRRRHRPADWNAMAYRPAGGTPLLACRVCAARYLDDEPGRAAHVAVFGHQPRPGEPAQPQESTEGEPT